MSDLPQGWARTTIGECQGRTSSIDPRKFPDERFDLYSVPSYSEYRPDSVEGHEIGSTKQEVREHDVLLCKIVPHIRRGWTIPAAAEHRQIASGEWIVFRDHGLEPEYIRRFVLSDDFHEQFMQTIAGVGGSLTRARPAEAAKIELPVPPLSEQRRIVAKIDSLTGKSRRARDHLDHIPRLVEKYKQAILAAAFRGDLCTKRRSPKLLPLSEFIDSLDQGWSPKCASEPAGSNDWGVIKTTAIQSVHFLPQENKRLPTDLKPRPGIAINAGDVLTTRAGPRSRVAISCLVNEDHPKLMLCDKTYRLRINQEIADPAFVTYMLNTPQCLSELEVMKTGISDSGLNLTQGKFIALGIPAFSLPEQFEIVRHIQSAFVWIDRLTADATSARKLIEHLDQSVLAKAFKGELVPQDPADEPASALLDRIRAERAAAPKAKRGRKKAP
ncbi:hypothetical protein JK164_11430 [Gluconobacter kondonii]|uniref:hypothetical protein n=1 Tax=Gluconobacter kondonii TaxID=941463 RepID=UPI001B8D63F5|nr:hypothetical protein [Gluconobacter kondonii]MBS1066548.1 hypothetical protein [Gluconobacter kondonii]